MKSARQNAMREPVVQFLLIAYGLAMLLSLWIGLTGGQESEFLSFGLLAFFFPGVAMLLMKYGRNQALGPLGWNKFPIRWVLLALLIFPIVIHGICLPIELILNDNAIPWEPLKLRGWENLSAFELLWRILLHAVVGMLAISVFAFFEEIGWRVWLLPRLIKKYNTRFGVFLGAVIWALWHIPFVLGEIHYIHGTAEIWLLVLNPLGHIGAGIVLSWLWLNTNSIWVVCLAHGSLNNWGQYAFKYIQETGGVTPIPWLLVGLNFSLLTLGLFVLWRGFATKDSGQ